jgi:hypothetical protein
MSTATLTPGEAMIRRIQATPVRFKPEPRMFPKIYVYVSDCCNATADDWMQEIKRCPECKESCEFEEVG